MTQLTKTPKDKVNELKKFLKATKRPDEHNRARAILKLIQGKKRSEVAVFFDINIKTLDQWQRNFKQRGVKGLKTKPQIGNKKKLSKQAKEAIKEAINKNNPKQLGFKKEFWTVSLLKQYVKKEYGVVFKSPSSYQNLFKFCEFTFHKPNKVNKKQNPHIRRRFEETLKKSSNNTCEKIVWSW